MKIKRRRQVDGARFRLRRDNETWVAKYPGENCALMEAQRIVETLGIPRVQVLDIDADDVLYTVRREGKAVVTYAGDHAEAPPETQRGLEAAV